MNLTFCSIPFLFLVSSAFGQPADVTANRSELKGNVRSVTAERIYVRQNERNVGEHRQQLATTKYDEDGRVIEDTIYGNGFVRTLFEYSEGRTTAETVYFDASGNRLSDPSKFKPKFEVVDETGLCAKYSIRKESDTKAKIDRTYETCLDGSSRAVTVDELTLDSELSRSKRTDAKNRSWESVVEYDAAGNQTEFRYTVSNGAKTYTHTMYYSDHKFDADGNWIRMTGTNFISTRPGELINQYNEVRTIEYFRSSGAKSPEP